LTSGLYSTAAAPHDVSACSNSHFMHALVSAAGAESENGSEEDSVEVVDLDVSITSSEDEDNDLDNSMENSYYSRPTVQRSKSGKSATRSTKTGRAKRKQTAEDYVSYNPMTCSFIISGVVRRLDGTNAPITVPCEVALDELRTVVAEKLGRFPGLVALQYRLGSDSAKAGAISIQTDNELQMFKDRMRKLIVPSLLSNGKPSTRALKPVLVYFEDSNNEQTETIKNTTNSKKNLSSSSRQSAPSSSSGQSELSERRTNIIGELQERWKCSKHTKDRDVQCYNPSGNVCYVLTHSNLAFWALAIVCFSFTC